MNRHPRKNLCHRTGPGSRRTQVEFGVNLDSSDPHITHRRVKVVARHCHWSGAFQETNYNVRKVLM